MNIQLFKGNRPGLILALPLLALMGLVVSCSGAVDGRVFIDRNGNGIFDVGDTPLAQAKVTILHDGSKMDETLTDPTGKFSVPSKGPGYYCIDVDTAGVPQKGLVVPAASTTGKALVSKTKEMESTYDTGSGGTPPGEEEQYACTDANGDGYCDEDGTWVGVEQQPTATSGGQQGNQPAAPPPPSGWTDQGYCQTLAGRSLSVSIPLQIDYSSAISDLPERAKNSYNAGEVFELPIQLPEGCGLDRLFLPEWISLVRGQRGIGYDPDVNLVTFSEIAFQTNGSKAAGASALVADISTVKPQFKVAEDIPAGSTDVVIKPKAKCGSDTIALAQIPLELVREMKAALLLNLIGTPALGKEIGIDAVVENKGTTGIDGGTLVVVFPGEVQLLIVDKDCRNLGSKIECAVDGVMAGAKSAAKTTKIQIPAKLDDDTKFTITASFTADGLEKPVEAEAIEFTLKAPTP